MAKRFTDSDKWKKPFIRSLKAPYKLLWLYILDECDHAGIWQVDFDVAAIKIGERLHEDKALECLQTKVVPFSGGEKWFIPDFIEFQYGILNSDNRAHNSVLTILNKYGLLQVQNKPLTSPLQGAKDKDKDMDKDKAYVLEPVVNPEPQWKYSHKGFYDSQVTLAQKTIDREMGDAYIAFVNYLHGYAEGGTYHENILAMKKQVSFDQYRTLKATERKGTRPLSDVVFNMENRAGLSKNYTCAFRTMNNWLQNDFKTAR